METMGQKWGCLKYLSCVRTEMIADVTKTNSYENLRYASILEARGGVTLYYKFHR